MAYEPPDDYVLFSSEMFVNAIITAVGFFCYTRSRGEFSKRVTVPICMYYFSRMIGLVVSGVLYITAYLYTEATRSEHYKNFGLCFYQTFGATIPASSVIIVAILSLAIYQMAYYLAQDRIQRLIYLIYLAPLLNMSLNVVFVYKAPIWIMINTEIILGLFIVGAMALLVRTSSRKDHYAYNSHHSMLIHQLWLFITAWSSYIIINTTLTVLNNYGAENKRYYSGFDSGFDVAFSVLCSVVFLVPKRVSYEYLFHLIDMIDGEDDSSQEDSGQ